MRQRLNDEHGAVLVSYRSRYFITLLSSDGKLKGFNDTQEASDFRTEIQNYKSGRGILAVSDSIGVEYNCELRNLQQ